MMEMFSTSDSFSEERLTFQGGDLLPDLGNDPLTEEKKAQCSVMKSVVRINQTAKPLAFTFVPTVRRLPAHVKIMDARFLHQPGKQQSPVSSSSIVNEPLCITEEEPSGTVRVEEGIAQGTSNQSWLNKKGLSGSPEEASQIQGIFKAEFVLLTDSDGNDSDCFSREDGEDLSAKALPLLSLPPNAFTDDKGSSVQPNVVGDGTDVPLLQDAEQKLDGDLQESLFQSNSSRSDSVSIQLLTSTIQNGDSTPTDTRLASASPVLNKSPLHFVASRNTEKKPSSLPRSTFTPATEMSFLSSSSLPSALHTRSLSPSNSSVKISKAASLPYPLSPLDFRSYSDLHSSSVWSSSSLPSSRSTVDSSTCIQSSPRSSSQNILIATTQQPSCHCSKMPDPSCQAPGHTSSATSGDVSSPPTQLSLLTSILRSGKLTPTSSKSSGQSTMVSSNASLSTIGSRPSSKSPTPQTTQASPPRQKARTFSPTPGTSSQGFCRMAGKVSSLSPRSLTSPLFPKPAAHSVHSTSAPLSKRHRNSSQERAQTPPLLPSTKHKAHHSKLGNSAPTLPSLCHDSKPPISPHFPSPIHRPLPPGPVHTSSHRSTTRQEQESPVPSERSATSQYSSLNNCPVKSDHLPLWTTSPPLSVSTSPLPTLEQSVSSSPPSSSSSSTLVNSFSSSSTPVNSPLPSRSLTLTPLNVSPSTTSPTQNQTSPHLSSSKLGSHSTDPTGPSSLKPPIPQQLSRQPSPPAKFNDTTNTPAHTAAHFSNPATDTPRPSPVNLPPSPSPTPRSGTPSPSQFLTRSTETKKPEQQFKIKSSYKAFAAIPTNTLLLDQKAIDEAVSDTGESAAQSTSEEIHSQFLFEPGSLRRQSEELYATIEQVLEDPLPSPASPVPRSAGRETKYANLHLLSHESTDNRPTRPGVIRPVTTLQKAPSSPKVEDICTNPFRKHTDETNDTEIKEPRHAITTIHENEALGTNEIANATEKPDKDLLQRKVTKRGSGRSVVDYAGSGQEALQILEEEQEQAVK